ncbi:MAG: chemotaxis protein CheW [Alphaproteobacteria bacterium]
MTETTTKTSRAQDDRPGRGEHRDFVTFMVADQWFGIPVLAVQDILGPQRIARIPLAPPEVAGSLNLRGRIVTAIDIRLRLGFPPRDETRSAWSAVVDRSGELYSLLVDQVGEVLSLPTSRLERNLTTIDPLLREVSDGIYRLEDTLLVVLAVDRLLDLRRAAA